MENFILQLKDFFSQTAPALILKAATALLALFIGFWLIKKLTSLITKSKLSEHLDRGLLNFFATAASIALKIILLLSLAGYVGIPTTSFITLLGTAGLAVGLSLQGSLSNLAGGIMLLAFKPFKVGDLIETDSSTGHVKDVGLMYTTLTSFDNKKIVIPNGTLSNAKIINYTGELNRRVDLEIGAGYDSDIDRVNGLLLRIASEHSLVLSEPAPTARLFKMGDSALVFALRVWCRGEDYWTVYFDLMETVKKEFDASGIEIPFPQLDVHSK